ncbi:MAG: isochorismatase family protein [Desulfobacterales bacterium]
MSHNKNTFPALIQRSDSLLVIVDVQKKLAPLIQDTPRIVANILKLVRLARIVEVPVLMSEQENLGETVDEIRLELQETPPARKLSFSCFGEDAFIRRLKAHDRRTLVLAGIEAHICVAQTALQAPADYRIVVIADAVASRSPIDCQAALARLRHEGATVATTEMVMYEWLERAGTDTFRSALPLLK